MNLGGLYIIGWVLVGLGAIGAVLVIALAAYGYGGDSDDQPL